MHLQEEELQHGTSMYDEFEDPFGLGGGLDEDDGGGDLLDPAARLPQSPGCEQSCEKRPGGEPSGEPAAKVQKSDATAEQEKNGVSSEQLAVIHANRLCAIAKKRARDDARCQQRWAEHWNGLADEDPSQLAPGPDQDLRQQILDLCLAIQVDDGGTYTDHQRSVAEEVWTQLDCADGLNEHELLLKRRRLEETDPEPDTHSTTQHCEDRSPLTQELAELLTDEEEDAAGPGPSEAPAAPPPQRARPDLDPRAGGLLEQLNSTHVIRTYRGLAWCGRCGCYAAYVGTTRPHVRELARACQPPRAKGLDNLRRLQLHPRRWPHPLKSWPDVATEQRRQMLIRDGARL